MNDFDDEPIQFGIPEENLDNQENQESQENQEDNNITINSDEAQPQETPNEEPHDEQIKSGFGNDGHKTGNLKESNEFTQLAKNRLHALRRERRKLYDELERLEDEYIRTSIHNSEHGTEDDPGDDWKIQGKIHDIHTKISRVNRGLTALVDAIILV